MLKGIPNIISPDLMKVMMEMGHGDEIVIADSNFPAVSCGKKVIRSDGHLIKDLLKAILQFFPLDEYVDYPVTVMSLDQGEKRPPEWDAFLKIISSFDGRVTDFEYMERFAYYERAKQAFAIISTGDNAFKGNLILKKGCVR